MWGAQYDPGSYLESLDDNPSKKGGIFVAGIIFWLVVVFWYWIRRKGKNPPSDTRFYIEAFSLGAIVSLAYMYLTGNL